MSNKTQQDTTDSAGHQSTKLMYPPYQSYFHYAQIAHNKVKLLAALKQVGYDITELQDKPVQQIMQEADNKLRKTYSVKVVGIKDGELGILSKRVDFPKPLRLGKKSTKKDIDKEAIFRLSQQPFQVHSQFQNKLLKSVKKQKDPQDEEMTLKLLNWQAEQFERMKGGRQNDTRDNSPVQGQQQDDDERKHMKKLPKMKKVNKRRMDNISPMQVEITKKDNVSDIYAMINKKSSNQKISYSRLLSEMIDRPVGSPNSGQLVITNVNRRTHEPFRIDGVIMELDEENDHNHSDYKLPDLQSIPKQFTTMQYPLQDNDGMQKKLKKIQDRLFKDQQNTDIMF